MSDMQMSDPDAGGAGDEFVDAPGSAEPPAPTPEEVAAIAGEDNDRREAYGSPTEPPDSDVP
jgi:hypothetical protein